MKKKNRSMITLPTKKKKVELAWLDKKHSFLRMDQGRLLTVVPNSHEVNVWRQGEGLDGDLVFRHARTMKFSNVWETAQAVRFFVEGLA